MKIKQFIIERFILLRVFKNNCQYFAGRFLKKQSVILINC